MAKEKFDRTKPHLNVGTIGHIDHGKTILTSTITNILSKHKLSNAKSYSEIAKGGEQRGETKILTIMVAHVEYSTAKRHYDHID